MASIYKPTYTRAIPPTAERFTLKAVAYVRWTGRNGKQVTARVCPKKPARCLVEGRGWWILYEDENGEPRRVPGSASKDVALDMMAKLSRRAEQIRAGILPAGVEEAGASLHVLADEYRAHLAALRRTAKHCRLTHARIVAALDGCRFRRFGDIQPRTLARWLAEERDKGLSTESSNHYLRAFGAFSRWVAGRVKSYNPLAELKPLNADGDRRTVRRTITRAEFERLLSATSNSVRTFRTLAGPDRWALYLVASFTGLRAAELTSLTRESMDLDAATVTVDAAYAKNRRRDVLPLAADLLRQLRGWLADRPRGPLWPGTWHERAAEMLERDLHAAELLLIDTRGRRFDFHAVRSFFITELARAGVSITIAQRLARHSTPALTARAYVHLGIVDLQAAVDKLASTSTAPAANLA